MTDTNHLTLALPFALPPAELAADLIRALQAPALSALLARHNKLEIAAYNDNCPILPHEAWLADWMMPASAGQRRATDAPFATRAMKGSGLTQGTEGHWFMLHPSNIQISRTHMLMTDMRQLHLSPEHGRALYELARPYFEESGMPLLYGGPDLWFVRADHWSGLRTASPDIAIAQNVGDWMPEGDRAQLVQLRKLQNEIQMLWHEHPVNQEREARGLAPVNAFWLWAGAPASAAAPATDIAIGAGPDWMMALAPPALRDVDAVAMLAAARGPHGAQALLANLLAPGLSGDWSSWIARMQQLEQDWFAPLLAALHDGTLGRLTLLLSHRHATLTVTTSKLAQRKFWRKPGLQPLLAQPATTPHLQNA